MARREIINPEDMEAEIQRLKQSVYVKLSQMEQRLKADKRRKYLADLRWHEKRGRMLAEMGLTPETLYDFVQETEEDAESVV